ncbi:putative glutamine amidotransferase [Geosporobacter subterraneus DSM 17957]|uniref:Putative glutamine amidotransferase n=1 Tax=Geosporobacter subterraneus DSM 17957 TaxID=1121919 RepID=A0A1M6M7D3_9FIRM|nr:gamma-glutamyl-gamma-aminobutyrate hydrolase family protein [Geosporobacter subterraneus]SHJ79368.1 putative glutamine amidotransferase [Geosporobacter subterraneus DSM 17957]
MKPVIGITTFHHYYEDKEILCGVDNCYVHSIILAGGVPVLIPIVHQWKAQLQYTEIIDGLLLSGGGDIAPLLYKEEPLKETAGISWERDQQEISLCKEAYEKGIPILGICRGLQVMNVAFGGTLYQDIEKQVPGALGHYPLYTGMDQLHHAVEIQRDSKLHDLFKEEKIYVNSFHHQAVDKIAEGFKATAFSKDGIIEAIETEHQQFAMGLQWHPEALVTKHPKFLKLFSGLIEESIKYKKKVR